MSLRNEIADYIRLIRNGAFTSDMIATDILQMIEKRIDSIGESRDSIDYFGYSGDNEFLSGFDIGFVEAFKLIKKEILKEND